MPWTGKERRKNIKPGRRHYDGTCILHSHTCEQIIDTEEAIKSLQKIMATKEDVERNLKFMKTLVTLFISGVVTIGGIIGGFALYKLWDISESISHNSQNISTLNANQIILMKDFGIRYYKIPEALPGKKDDGTE